MANSSGFRNASIQSSQITGTLSNRIYWADLSKVGIENIEEARSIRVYTTATKTVEIPRAIQTEKVMFIRLPTASNGTSIWVDWDGVRGDYDTGDTNGCAAVFQDINGYLPLYENTGTNAVNLVDKNTNTSYEATGSVKTNRTTHALSLIHISEPTRPY